MNKSIRTVDLTDIVPALLVNSVSDAAHGIGAGMRADAIVLGMPHLGANGLSETWLLKELGHRHWCLLAQSAGMPFPDFRDANGERVYAAFCAVSLTDGDLGSVEENDVLAIESRLSRPSRTQAASYHRIAVKGRIIGCVEMVSSFVRRTAGGGNHTVARVAVEGMPLAFAEPSDLASIAAAFRAGQVMDHLGFDVAQVSSLANATFTPCPAQDFNGAGFLYFTSFQSFVDRAEWSFAREKAMIATTRRRDIFYRSNIDPGDSIRVALIGHVQGEGQFAHHCCIFRESDNAIIADVFSLRSVTPLLPK